MLPRQNRTRASTPGLSHARKASDVKPNHGFADPGGGNRCHIGKSDNCGLLSRKFTEPKSMRVGMLCEKAVLRNIAEACGRSGAAILHNQLASKKLCRSQSSCYGWKGPATARARDFLSFFRRAFVAFARNARLSLHSSHLIGTLRHPRCAMPKPVSTMTGTSRVQPAPANSDENNIPITFLFNFHFDRHS